ncbi:nedd8 [Anaeramoeba ignava]|uniref:Nedd8 n=1 Tax=Anaeramoeba ignava TaxID=1746090 RepID=A0A9Q0LJT4_ANAIG|nr:nedd8 [Anaeramoeba ignava]
MQIKVKLLTGREVAITVEPTDTVLKVKERVEEVQGIPVPQQRVVFSGNVLKDDKTLEEIGLKHGSVVHLVLALRG